MSARTDHTGTSRESLFDNIRNRRQQVQPADESEEVATAAFGYLRGPHERATSIEFRLLNGNREWYPYGLLAGCRYDPSVGIMLKFTGDVLTIVLIHGSNLDIPVNEGSMDLIQSGLERHRVTWIREMNKNEPRKSNECEPTVDRIQIEDFESTDDVQAWLQKTVPAFVRR